MPAPYPPALRPRIVAVSRRSFHSPHDPIVRDLVRQRAADACEYCLMPTNGKFQIEHIIPRSRWADYIQRRYPGLRRPNRLTLRGPDHIANYAWSCYFCNHAKGGEERSPRAQRLFDPRVDHWPDHFMFAQSKDYGVIVGVTRAGDETARALRFHEGGAEGALVERYTAILHGLYPPPWLIGPYRLYL